MKIAHVSDLHGNLLPIPYQANIIINSGDWLPDCGSLWSKQNVKSERQKEYFYKNIEKIVPWIKGKPYYFINGNHDFIDSEELERILRTNGISAYSLEDKIVSHENMTMYGFPWVPYINGSFNYELVPLDMEKKVKELMEVLENNVIDVLVLHCPIKNELSSEGFEDYGNNLLENHIKNLDKAKVPGLILCGHLHEAKGIKYSNILESLVVNSATTCNIIEY